MQLRNIELSNFRGFERLACELHPECTLVVGVNGSGKTSLLDAIAVILYPWLQSVGATSGSASIRPDDRRLIRQTVQGAPSLEIAGETSVRVVFALPGGAVSTGTAEYQRYDWDNGKLVEAARNAALRLGTGQTVELPVLAYYRTGRLWRGKVRPNGVERLKSNIDGYRHCLDAAVGYQLLEEWMAWRETVRLQEISRAVESGTSVAAVREPLLEAVANAVTACVEGAQRFYYSVNHEELRVDFKDGRTLPFRMLSDGYRNLLALAGDIAWRAARLNPHHGEHAARESGGVVLIDELDLHLHPSWQRSVLPDLRRAFPRIQFIATTHSPQVLSTAEPAWIRVLHLDGRVSTVEHTLGRDSNSLLEDVFGVPERPPKARDEIRRLFDLVDRGAFSEAEELWTALYEDLGPDDPDIARARTALDLERGV